MDENKTPEPGQGTPPPQPQSNVPVGSSASPPPPTAPPSPPAAQPPTSPGNTAPKKKSSALKIIIIILVILVILGVVGTLLSAFVFKKIFQFGVKKATNGTVNVGDKGVTIKDKNGNSSFSTEAKLPDGFPSDVPIYKPSTITVGAKTGNNYDVSLQTSDSSQKVISYYKTELAKDGWSANSDGSSETTIGNVTTETMTKDNRTVTVITSTDNGTTTINLTVATQESTSSPSTSQ